jgi:RHS repeat-associated protein
MRGRRETTRVSFGVIGPLVAMVAILGVVRPGHAAPADVCSMPTPKLGADPHKAEKIDRRITTDHALVSDEHAYRLRATKTDSWVLAGGTERTYARTETVWDPSLRLALEEHVHLDAETVAVTARSYDEVGNVIAVIKPVDTVHDYGTGALLRSSGPNEYPCDPCFGLAREQTRTDVDGLGRPVATYVSRDVGFGYVLAKVAETGYVDPVVDGAATSVTSRSLLEYGTARWAEERTSYDGHGRPIATEVMGHTPTPRTHYSYAADGTLVAVAVPDPSQDTGAQVTYHYTYDSLGRPTGLRRPDGSGTDLSYAGVTHTRRDVPGAAGGAVGVTELHHDAFGRLAMVREGLGAPGSWVTTTYGYDPRDAVRRIADPDGIVTELEHDWAGRRTRVTRESRVWRYGYDHNGNLSWEISPPEGALESPYTTTFAYDDLDRVVSRLIAPRELSLADREALGVHQVVYAYDGLAPGTNGVGRLTQVTTLGPGNQVVFDRGYRYDAEGNEIEDRLDYQLAGQGGGRTVRTTYDPGGRARELDYGDGAAHHTTTTRARFLYDGRGLAAQVRVQLAGGAWTSEAILQRNAAGLVTQRVRPTIPAQTATWSYDPLGRIVRQRVQHGTTLLAEQVLQYYGSDDLRRLEHWASGAGWRTFQYAYDALHQLRSVVGTGLSAGYDFTPGGRLALVQVDAQPASGQDVQNRLVQYIYQAADREMVTELRNPDGSYLARYAYDPAGNTTLREQQGTPTTFLWDGDDQLRRATSGSSREEYFYGHDGQRLATVRRTAFGAGGTFGVSQLKLFHGPLEVWLSSGGAATHRFAHVSLGTPVARVESRPSVTPTVETQYHSTLQSLLAAVSPSGSLEASFVYGPYGEILHAAGTAQSTHRRRYNDKHQDDLTGLYYYGYRYYDPVSLLWTSADPQYRFTPDRAWDQPRLANLYSFNLGNPLKYVDPDGRHPVALAIGGRAMAAAARTPTGRRVIAGALAGATTKISLEGIRQAQSRRFNGMRLFAAGLSGATEGAMLGASLAAKPVQVAVAAGTGAGAGSAVENLVTGQPMGVDDAVNATASAALGAAGAGIAARAAGGRTIDPARMLPERAGPTGHISPGEVVGRTPAQIDARARELGLQPRGPDPAGGRGAYVDPQTGQQRILSHPNASPPHGHVNNPRGQRIGPDGRIVAPESSEAHLPIRRQ